SYFNKKHTAFENYYSLPALEHHIELFVEPYNQHRYHSALKTLPRLMCIYDPGSQVRQKRARIRRETILMRRRQNCGLRLA
ncbi:MAG: hypothetical protein MIO92_08530, partial [Methanosarcinaceae archaeon]|nr:hypothetical protein [Methanosarcinaceae archaeon]